MEEQLEEVQQVLLYARAQRNSKQKEQPGQTFALGFVSPVSAAAMMREQKGTDDSLRLRSDYRRIGFKSDSFSNQMDLLGFQQVFIWNSNDVIQRST